MPHLILLLFVGLFGASLPSDPPLPASPVSGPKIEDFRWIAGCWKMEDGGKETEEQWMKPDGQTMIGMSRISAGGETMSFEFMQIRQMESGEIVFLAQPSGQKPASFRLKSSGKKEIVFENSAQDFPQRIIYRLRKDGSLLGRIEGSVNGKPHAVHFPMKRVKCP
jgi:hypothetical protein